MTAILSTGWGQMSSLRGAVYPARRRRGGGGDLHVDGEDDTGEGTQSVKSKTKAAAAAKIRADNMVRGRRGGEEWICC